MQVNTWSRQSAEYAYTVAEIPKIMKFVTGFRDKSLLSDIKIYKNRRRLSRGWMTTVAASKYRYFIY